MKIIKEKLKKNNNMRRKFSLKYYLKNLIVYFSGRDTLNNRRTEETKLTGSIESSVAA